MCNSSGVVMVGRIAERPLLKKGDANISSALKRVQDSICRWRVQRENEAQREDGAEDVAGDHDAPAVVPVQDHAGDGSGENCRDGAREHDAGHHQS